MIPDLIIGIGMDECAQRSSINHKPCDKGTELLRCEDVDFEHADGMWADGSVPDFVDAEFWNCLEE
jgi:hypothetical protein